MAAKKRRFGWLADVPDKRDYVSYLTTMRYQSFPPALSLVGDSMPPIFDQGNLGACVANAVGAAYEFMDRDNGTDAHFQSSRLFVYYNARSYIGTTNYDSGCYIRDGIKALNKFGSLAEYRYPYVVSRFKQKPSATIYKAALPGKISEYARVPQTADQIKSHLMSRRPIVFGFTVYDSFLTSKVARTGIVPMPNLQTESIQGGHAVVLVGWNDPIRCYEVRNSWGKDWGAKGYCWMPYEYVHDPNLADDFWAISMVP